ncbi:MAG: triose-phosphate isomerase [Bacilli bacterium]|nr:triose-phosphate isomerase [Bacilli bacterium]
MEKIVVANLKMNFTIDEMKDYLSELNKMSFNKHHFIVCPTFIYLPLFNNNYFIGAQNCHYLDKGSFTGEVSPSQLKSIGVSYVILGHSERRKTSDEDNNIMNNKAKAVLTNKMIPIICVGETMKERKNNKTLERIKTQVYEILKDIDKNNLENIIIAYEPIWAIGTNITPTNSEIEEVATYIKQITSINTKVLYGGSVNSNNIKELKLIKDLNGFLIGGSSLNIKELTTILDNY